MRSLVDFKSNTLNKISIPLEYSKGNGDRKGSNMTLECVRLKPQPVNIHKCRHFINVLLCPFWKYTLIKTQFDVVRKNIISLGDWIDAFEMLILMLTRYELKKMKYGHMSNNEFYKIKHTNTQQSH